MDIAYQDALEASEKLVELFRYDKGYLSDYFKSIVNEHRDRHTEVDLVSFYLSEKPSKSEFVDEIFQKLYFENIFDLHAIKDYEFTLGTQQIFVSKQDRKNIYIPLLEAIHKDWVKDISERIEKEVIGDVNRAIELLKKEPIFNMNGFFISNRHYKHEEKKILLYSQYAYIEAENNYNSVSFHINKQKIKFELKALFHIYLLHFGPDTNAISCKTYHNPKIDFRKITETIQEIFGEISNTKIKVNIKRFVFDYKNTIYELRTSDNKVNSFYPLTQKRVNELIENHSKEKISDTVSVFVKN